MAYGSKKFTTAQTATVLESAGAGFLIILRRVSIYCSNAVSVNTQGVIGFGTNPQKIISEHPGIAPGSGFVEITTRESHLAVGLEAESLTFTCGVPTSGSIVVNYTFDLMKI